MGPSTSTSMNRPGRRRGASRTRGPVAILATLCLTLASAPLLRAENAILMGYGEGTPGQRGIEVIVTATNDVAIHGYSVAFTYPAEVLTLSSVSTVGTHVDALAPDFVAPSLDNQLGVGRLGVIFSFTEPIVSKALDPLPSNVYPRIIARLSFDVKSDALGGRYPLSLVDGIGQPASFNRFSNAGNSISPRLQSGAFKVEGGNVLTLDKKIAFPGATSNLAVFAYAKHPDPLAGFQIGFTYDKLALEVRSVTYGGTSLDVELGRSGLIEAFNYDIDLNYGTTKARTVVATLFDFVPPILGQTLSPSVGSPTAQSLVKFTFAVSDAADDTAQYQELQLMDTGIPGAIDNRFIVGDRSLDPELVSGRVYFSQGTLAGRIVDAQSLLPVRQVQVTTDPDGYTTTTAADGRFRLEALPAGPYAILLSSAGHYLARQEVESASGTPIVVAGDSAVTDVGDIPLYTIPAGPDRPFLRGYVNSDNKLDLSDAVSLLLYLFRGGEPPTCFLAADVNDDNRLDISDTVYLLNHLFTGGPQPPAPYSIVGGVGCTIDPTPGGSLTCEQFTCQ